MRRRRRRRKIKDEVKMELIISFIEDEDVDNQNLNETKTNIKNFGEAIPVIKEHEKLIKIKKKAILNTAYRQDVLFKRVLKDYLKNIKEICKERENESK